MITAILVYNHPRASQIVEAVEPDNTPEIRMKHTKGKVLAVVQAKSVRTTLASCDDLFANLEIAEKTLCDG